MSKATNMRVTRQFLAQRTAKAERQGYPKYKWIEFCEAMLDLGYDLHLYEARTTFSKYITVSKNWKSFKVRFSNHRPAKERQENGDCDFFVGVSHGLVTTTAMAIEAVKNCLDAQRDA
jgi:hypothetical protein